MDKIVIDGYEYYRVVPLSEYSWSMSHFGLLAFNPTVYCLFAGIFAVALWLVIDLACQVHRTFIRFRGCYYWSIVCTTFGIACHTVAFIIKQYFALDEAQSIGSTLVAKVGWVMNTTGFSMVLYSRLNLVVQDRRALRFALAAIIVDGIMFHTPAVVCSFGMSTPNAAFWLPHMEVAEKVQVIGFTLQEFALSTIYTWMAAELLRHRSTPTHRKLFAALLFAQSFGFIADTAMIVLDYDNMFILKGSLHPFIYAIKLKIEFIVLNQLLKVVRPDSNDFLVPAVSETPGMRRGSIRPPSPKQTSLVEEGERPACMRCQSLSEDTWFRGSRCELQTHMTMQDTNITKDPRRPFPWRLSDTRTLVPSTKTSNDADEDRQDRELDDLERQYLGNFRD